MQQYYPNELLLRYSLSGENADQSSYRPTSTNQIAPGSNRISSTPMKTNSARNISYLRLNRTDSKYFTPLDIRPNKTIIALDSLNFPLDGVYANKGANLEAQKTCSMPAKVQKVGSAPSLINSNYLCQYCLSPYNMNSCRPSLCYNFPDYNTAGNCNCQMADSYRANYTLKAGYSQFNNNQEVGNIAVRPSFVGLNKESNVPKYPSTSHFSRTKKLNELFRRVSYLTNILKVWQMEKVCDDFSCNRIVEKVYEEMTSRDLTTKPSKRFKHKWLSSNAESFKKEMETYINQLINRKLRKHEREAEYIAGETKTNRDIYVDIDVERNCDSHSVKSCPDELKTARLKCARKNSKPNRDKSFCENTEAYYVRIPKQLKEEAYNRKPSDFANFDEITSNDRPVPKISKQLDKRVNEIGACRSSSSSFLSSITFSSEEDFSSDNWEESDVDKQAIDVSCSCNDSHVSSSTDSRV